ncbi:hypothetical protein FB45DRAFT_1059256 [Roridomyces roridus]|uniref:Fungal-type protein kinase domain-containing protein n=1 Tax=Roridomyces roridus TaxID=1738132 RepID=A0AAD7FMA6_9AGAR|nr:hypothetical protein FB45DRAFT_1059256 [Roridomyces roridus]
MAHALQLYIFDRAGLVTSSSFDIHKEPKRFIHVITALVFADDPTLLGYDTSIVERNGSRFITVDGTEYQIGDPLFISDVIRGRGTVCWHARHGNEDFVIKDTWADNSREHSVAEILHRAAGIEGVPKRMPSFRFTKARDVELLDTIETRIHRRLVITPLCSSLPNFANRRELLPIFIDVVTAHRDLCENKRIVHRDISVNNFMIMPPPTASLTDQPQPPTDVAAPAADASQAVAPSVASAPRRGIIIDFDYALIMDPNASTHKVAIGHRTGTLPFMAIDVLIHGGKLPKHEPRHDLESMLYVLIWICLHYAGPGDVERHNFDITNSKIANWVQGDYQSCGHAKYYVVGEPESSRHLHSR